MLGLFLTFGYATLFFTLLNIKKLPELYSLIVKNIKPLFYLNVATLLSWIGTFLALTYVDPATKICIGFSLIAVTNFFIFTPIKAIRHNKRLLLIILLILFSMTLIILQQSNFQLHDHTKLFLLGVLIAAIGGIGGGFIGINAEKVGLAGFSATQILATRFYLLVLVSGGIFFFSQHSHSVAINWSYYLLAAIIVVLLPLLTYQLAIKSLGALIVSFIEPLTPVITYFLQIFILGYRFTILTLILLLISSATIIWLVRTEQKVRNNG
jgi:drug/metabolite transporter (DMT)-like permease